MCSRYPFIKPQGFWDIFPFQLYFLYYLFFFKSERNQQLHREDNPMRLWSCPTLETVPTLNTKCFCFVFPPPRSLPSSVDTKEAAILWANDSKKILGPQCVHSSLDSLVLGSAFKCEGTMRQFKGNVQQFGSKTSFSGIGHPKCNVTIMWTYHLSCFMSFKKSQIICLDFVLFVIYTRVFKW